MRFPNQSRLRKPAQRVIRSLLLLYLVVPGTVLAETLHCPCKVTHVVDGDTLFVLDQTKSARKIWLAGIDAPELAQDYGSHSKRHLEQLVLGQSVEVEYAKRDRYGRIIGKMIKDGQDINLQQIKAGLAWHFKQGQDELSRQDDAIYRSAEETAKTDDLGLWSFAIAIPPWDFRSGR